MEQKKIRTFVFTRFNLCQDQEYQTLIGTNGVRFLAYGLETCPTTGRQHHQGWICFKSQISTSTKSICKIAKLLGNAHVEPMYGSLKDSNNYCSKEDTLHKFGDEPKQGDRSDLKDVIKRIRDGETTSEEICLEDPVYFHMYGRTIQKAEDIHLRKRFRQWQTKGIWYYGNTGAGKSHLAFEGYSPDTHYSKPLQENWWDGYTGQRVVILNEFRGEISFSELLSLVDKWPHSVPRRNREPAPFLAELVIVTSALHPQEVWKKRGVSDSMDQLYRRFDVGLVRQGQDTIWEIQNGSEVLRG